MYYISTTAKHKLLFKPLKLARFYELAGNSGSIAFGKFLFFNIYNLLRFFVFFNGILFIDSETKNKRDKLNTIFNYSKKLLE